MQGFRIADLCKKFDFNHHYAKVEVHRYSDNYVFFVGRYSQLTDLQLQVRVANWMIYASPSTLVIYVDGFPKGGKYN